MLFRSQVAMITTGIMTAMAMEAAELLADEGIEASVLHIHTIKPIDREAIRSIAEETGCIVTAEEHSIIGGLGGAVAEVLGETCPVPMVRVGIQDHFGESGTPADLLEKYELTSHALVQAVKEVLDKKKELCR